MANFECVVELSVPMATGFLAPLVAVVVVATVVVEVVVVAGVAVSKTICRFGGALWLGGQLVKFWKSSLG